MQVRVMGLPQQQGSKNPWGGEANKNLTPWRGHVSQTVGEAWGDRPLLLGPVRLQVTFTFPRPKSHFNSKGQVKPNAPYYKTSAPDLDKLQRAIGDALTGQVFRDDALVVEWHVRKVYDDKTFADIWITDLSGGSYAHGTGTRTLGVGTDTIWPDHQGAEPVRH